MFTRDSKILSHRLTTPLTSVANAVGDVFKPTYNQIIKYLFANNEQGFAYDPNDLTTMFQDAAGTVPVTAVGRPVGLILDKSKGLKLESNLVLGDGKHEGTELYILKSDGNGSVSDLSLNTVNPLSGSKDVRFKLTSASSAGGFRPLVSVRLSENPAIGSFYQFSFKYKVLSGEAKILAYHTGLGTSSVNQTLTGEGTFTLVMAYLGTQVAGPTLYFGESLFDMQMDDFEYRRIQGNHAYQTTSASRPILRQNAVTGANYLEFDGSDDFLQTNNIDFTATDKVSLFAGVRKLSDATNGILLELSASITTNSGTFCVFAPRFTGGAGNFGLISKGTVITEVSTPAILAPVSAVISVKSSILASVLSMRVDGALSASSNNSQGTGNYGNYPLYIGRRGGTLLPFNGHIYSLIGIGRLTSDSETVAIEKELAKRVGVTLNV